MSHTFLTLGLRAPPVARSHSLPPHPQLEQVYGEIYRVLKPGSYFVSYEWVSTQKFDVNNAEHVKIMDEINFGNGLPVRLTLDRRIGLGWMGKKAM